MQIYILSVGKIKESWLRDGIAMYAQRILNYSRIEIIEVADASDTLPMEKALSEEADRILSRLPKTSGNIVLLDIKGKQYSSEDFAELFDSQLVQGGAHITFILGGSRGVHERIQRQANLKFSLGKITLPHQLCRLVLLEQIYRSFKILKNEPYHK